MKIIVLTPIKNEDWILKTFLELTSIFADHIIILDQNSSDKSLEIAQSFKKVIIIENKNNNYSESERQNLLIEKARELFPQDKVLIALDADEIISADSIYSLEWNLIKKTSKGTVLKFFKPNLYLTSNHYIENKNSFWPLGFIDDNITQHRAKLVHSTRVPNFENQPSLILKEIKFLHLAYLRPKTQESKLRFYSVIEKEADVNPWYLRRRRYIRKKHLLPYELLEDTPKEWINYEDINLNLFSDDLLNWQDKEVLLKIIKYPFWYFWLDDIWYINWDEAKRYFKIKSDKKIIPPPRILKTLLHYFDQTINNK